MMDNLKIKNHNNHTSRYEPNLRAAADWLIRSELRSGGSSAHYFPLFGWSRAYPETTGYIIPTLLAICNRLKDPKYNSLAIKLGYWLLSIQNADGSWNGGLHPTKIPRPSVFNTGQILKGLIALWRHTLDPLWIEAARRGNNWLSQGMAPDGLWLGRDYRATSTPSYYTHVLWPMLEVAQEEGNVKIKTAVERGLSRVLERLQPNGIIYGWGFTEDNSAFTHTIAYTIRGLQECGRLLGRSDIQDAVIPALNTLVRRSELKCGQLPGTFNSDWKSTKNYVCLTGNAQIAKCILIQEARVSDLRLVSAAARMIDVVCSNQNLVSLNGGIRGGVAGSSPLWGPYMRFRYPNWAAKYFCDAILALLDRLDLEK